MTSNPFGSMAGPAGAGVTILGERGGLLTDTAKGEVIRRVPMITDEGHNLWHYAEGVWKPGAEHKVAQIVAELTGDKYRLTHSSTITSLLQSQEPELLDEVDPTTLNVRDGLLDWERARRAPASALTPHDPAMRPPSVTQFPVSWEEARKGTTTVTDRFLSEVFPDGEAGVNFAYQIIGYGLYSGNPLHKAIMLDGVGRNGKTTYLNLARAVYGPHNVSGVSLQALGENRFAAAQLHGVAANIAGDLDSRALKDAGLFKMITGEDLLQAEHKYGQPFKFTARCLPLFAANEKPLSTDTSIGYLSRWIVVPFEAYFSRDNADPHLEAKLTAEVPGVFYKAVRALGDLMAAGGFALPPSIAQATEDYAIYVDPVRGYITSAGLIIPADEPNRAHTKQKALYDDFAKWAEANGLHVIASRKFNARFPVAFAELMGVRPDVRTLNGYPHWTHVEIPGAAKGAGQVVGAPAS